MAEWTNLLLLGGDALLYFAVLTALFVAMVLSAQGPWYFAPVTAVIGVIGGFVVSGSNRSTAQEAEEQIAASEARRAELIGAIGLRVVSERPTLH